MWAHIGRLAGEFPHIHKMGNESFLTIHGREHIEQSMMARLFWALTLAIGK